MTWLKPFFDDYKGSQPAQETSEVLSQMLNHSDQQLAAVAMQGRAGADGSLSLKKYRLPYLEANLGNLDLFSERIKFLSLEIAAQTEIINEEIERVRFYYSLTFESEFSAGNHERARRSVVQSSLNVEPLSRQLLDKLFELDRLLRKG